MHTHCTCCNCPITHCTDPESLLRPLEELAALTDLEAEAKEHVYLATVLEEQMGAMNVNLGTIEAYRAKEAEYQGRLRELEEATAQRDEVCQGWWWWCGCHIQ